VCKKVVVKKLVSPVECVAGGEGSLALTFLRSNSLLTGKFTGDSRFFVLRIALHSLKTAHSAGANLAITRNWNRELTGAYQGKNSLLAAITGNLFELTTRGSNSESRLINTRVGSVLNV
jgi:hypothetical protein